MPQSTFSKGINAVVAAFLGGNGNEVLDGNGNEVLDGNGNEN